ncbi:MAG TPA: DUF6603 domain-containing protein [Kofleriaceae bacterium]|nr:DUF6603 domain-containing protein [Kofleriaceae bacterium]
MATVEQIASVLARSIEPLALGLIGGDDEIRAFVAELGWILPAGAVPPSLSSLAAPAQALLDALETLAQRRDERVDDQATEGDLAAAIASVATELALFASDLHRVPSALATELPAAYVSVTQIDTALESRIYERLVADLIEDAAFPSYALGVLFGVIEERELEEDLAIHQPEFIHRRVHWDRLSTVVSDPAGALEVTYGWGTPDLDWPRLADALRLVGVAFYVPPAHDYPSEGFLKTVAPTAPYDPEIGPDSELRFVILDAGPIQLSLTVTPLPASAAPRGLAVSLVLTGLVAATIPLLPGFTIELEANVDLASGLAIALRPNVAPTAFLQPEEAAVAFERGRVAAKLAYTRGGDTRVPIVQFGSRSALEAKVLALRAGVEAGHRTDVFVEGQIEGGRLVIAPDSPDSFLARVLPTDGVHLDFDMAVGWSKQRGVYLTGGASLETAIALHRQIGPLRVDTLYVRFSTQGRGVALEVSVAANVALGPIAVTVDRLGVLGSLALEPGGNLGPAQIDLGFKPPSGAGISIDAGIVRGGGYLGFEPEAGRYYGALALELFNISVTALALIETRPSFSFVAIITSEFPPMPVGFGLTLEGVGGLIAIDRTVATDVIVAGLRDGALDPLLFPPDPITNAPALIAGLGRVFPASPGRYVFGPVVKLGWGTPKLVEAELGVMLEVPAPVRLILAGQIHARLPVPSAPIVEVHMDVLGVLDLDGLSLSIDATLRDSRIAAFSLTGDAALRARWGLPPTFAYALGGLHPAFEPPPGFPTLRRLTVALGADDNPRITLQGYLALTSNTLQFGARAELYAAAGGFNLLGWVGFDVLVSIIPFEFRADFTAGVDLRRGSSRIAGVRVEGTLTGPSPFHITGEACLSLMFFDVCVDFDATFGLRQLLEVIPIDPWPALKAALEDPLNWIGVLPRALVVSLLDAPGLSLVDPAGSLQLNQKVLPLRREIRRYGATKLPRAERFTVASATVGTAGAGVAPLEDYFAPAQFLELSDAQKLSRPSFERMDAGVKVEVEDVTHGPPVSVVVEYETIRIDDEFTARRLPRYQLVRGHALAIAAVGAPRATKYGVSRAALATLDDDAFVVVSTTDLAARGDVLAAPASKTEALEALAAFRSSHPVEAAQLDVVPMHEARP